MGKFKDLTGQKFHHLTVISRSPIKSYKVIWICKCDCGNITNVTGGHLKNGNTKSCGCIKIENLTTHGMTGSAEYKSWGSMIQRCTNPKNSSYANYGGRGISVCDDWMDFKNFYADMGDKPKGSTIDRIDNNKGYSKDNCRWATRTEQQGNIRSNFMLTFQDRYQCASAWAREFNIPIQTLYNRLNRSKWTLEKTLTTPVRIFRNK